MKRPDVEKSGYSIPQAAVALNMPQARIRKAVAYGDLKSTDLGGVVRVPASEIRRVRELFAEPPPEAAPLASLKVGTQVVKPNGYPFPGEVRAAFTSKAGKLRYVVESSTAPGLLHIFSPEQIEEAP